MLTSFRNQAILLMAAGGLLGYAMAASNGTVTAPASASTTRNVSAAAEPIVDLAQPCQILIELDPATPTTGKDKWPNGVEDLERLTDCILVRLSAWIRIARRTDGVPIG